MEFPDPENLDHKNFQPTTDQLAPRLLDDAIRINESVARIFSFNLFASEGISGSYAIVFLSRYVVR